MQVVTRRYSIKKILKNLPKEDRLIKTGELMKEWEVDSRGFNILINSIEDKGPLLGEIRLVIASEILNTSMRNLMTPFEEVSRRPVKT